MTGPRRSSITAFKYDNLPVTCGTQDAQGACSNPVDPEMVAMLQPYDFQLHQVLDLDGVFTYVSNPNNVIRDDPSGGDSQLGNLVARSMQLEQGVDADFAFTNSLGIRTDLDTGPVDLEEMYNVFPFENTIVLMFLSGNEIQETLDFVAGVSSSRGCRSQVQVDGIWFTMVCGANPNTYRTSTSARTLPPARRLEIDQTKCRPVIPEGLYRVAVNNYIAAGGSGFIVLQHNTAQYDTKISLRDGLRTYIRSLHALPGGDQVDDTLIPTRKTVLENYAVVIACLGFQRRLRRMTIG